MITVGRNCCSCLLAMRLTQSRPFLYPLHQFSKEREANSKFGLFHSVLHTLPPKAPSDGPLRKAVSVPIFLKVVRLTFPYPLKWLIFCTFLVGFNVPFANMTMIRAVTDKIRKISNI